MTLSLENKVKPNQTKKASISLIADNFLVIFKLENDIGCSVECFHEVSWSFYGWSRAVAWNEFCLQVAPKCPISPKHFTTSSPNHSGLFYVYKSFTT